MGYSRYQLLYFRYSKYQVVYPQTRDDFINEGISLNNCAGSAGYYDRHVLAVVFKIERMGVEE